MKRIRLIVFLGLLLLSVNTLAAEGTTSDALAGDRTAPALNSQALQHWQQLSAAEQQTLRERYRQYQALPAEQQQQLRQRLQRFKAMNPQQQQRIQKRFQRWQALPLKRREQLRQTYQDFSQLTPEHQQQLRHQLEQLKDLPETERARRTQQLRHDYMGGQRQMSPAGGMRPQPMRRMRH